MKNFTHGRPPVHTSMPPMAETCAEFKGFAKGDRRMDRIVELLSSVIQRHRRATPQRFYPMREVAAFFGVSLNTAAVIYRRLDREGLLTRVRGSQTMMAARVLRPRFSVRGVVCMPVWLPGFLNFRDWRRFFSQLEEELLRYRFILQPIFYRQSEDEKPEFVDRILKYNPDYLLWNHPFWTDEMIMQSIADTGVPLLVIQGSAGKFPGRVYPISYERAFRRGLREWKASGEVDEIILPTFTGVSTAMVQSALEASGLPFRFVKYSEDKSPLADYMKQLARNPRSGIIFDDDFLYLWMCGAAPAMVYDLFHRHRVMVMREVTICCPTRPKMMADAMLLPWKSLAIQIAADLGKAKGAIPSEQAVCQAQWHSRIPLEQVVQRGTRD